MEYMRLDGAFPKLSHSAVTLGKFDGIHRGHQKLIRRIVEQKESGAQAVVCAFVSSGESLLSSRERNRFLEGLGVDILLECQMKEKLRSMKAETFVREVLMGDLKTAFVAVGEDFRFGNERKGTPQLLSDMGRKLGFQTEILSKEMEGHRKVSSTYIREELSKGNMERVTSLLGRRFPAEGVVEHGRGMGHRLFFPTTNLIPPAGKLMPPNGVYATVSDFGDKKWQGITNVGYKPTVGKEKFLGVETYLFDCDEDLYGKSCTVEFCTFVRPEQKFHSFEALKRQILQDTVSGRLYFSERRED